jgi:hypothetical protein
VTQEEEASVRAEERLKVLREVRKHVAKMNNNPDNDPYLWGYGGSEIQAYLTGLVSSARVDTAGQST